MGVSVGIDSINLKPFDLPVLNYFPPGSRLGHPPHSCSGNGVVLKVPDQSLLRSEEHTSELQSRGHLVCRLLLEKKKHGEGGSKSARQPTLILARVDHKLVRAMRSYTRNG